jgi:hypothetical protein
VCGNAGPPAIRAREPAGNVEGPRGAQALGRSGRRGSWGARVPASVSIGHGGGGLAMHGGESGNCCGMNGKEVRVKEDIHVRERERERKRERERERAKGSEGGSGGGGEDRGSGGRAGRILHLRPLTPRCRPCSPCWWHLQVPSAQPGKAHRTGDGTTQWYHHTALQGSPHTLPPWSICGQENRMGGGGQ